MWTVLRSEGARSADSRVCALARLSVKRARDLVRGARQTANSQPARLSGPLPQHVPPGPPRLDSQEVCCQEDPTTTLVIPAQLAQVAERRGRGMRFG